MRYRLSIIAVSGIILCGVRATAAELPIYEVTGFPITPHQLAVLGPANTEQGLPALTLTVAGMPASAHQIAVLAPHQRVLVKPNASDGQRITNEQARLSPVVVTGLAR